jgi:hypothetical protein
MKELQLVKFPDRKRTAIVAYEAETNTAYVVGYLNKEENKDLFIEALTSRRYVKDDKQYAEVIAALTGGVN